MIGTFEEFYALYPKKVDRPDARKAWEVAIKTTPADYILAGLRSHLDAGTFDSMIKDAERQGKPRKQFICSPGRWLRNQRWDNELPEQSGRATFRNPAIELLARDWLDAPAGDVPELPGHMLAGPSE